MARVGRKRRPPKRPHVTPLGRSCVHTYSPMSECGNRGQVEDELGYVDTPIGGNKMHMVPPLGGGTFHLHEWWFCRTATNLRGICSRPMRASTLRSNAARARG